MENMLREISPALYLLVTSQIQAFEDQSEVAIRTDLLGSLGDDMVSLSFLHDDIDDSLPSLFLILNLCDPLKGPQAF